MDNNEIIQKAENLVSEIDKYKKNRYTTIEGGVSIDDLILDVELLIYSFDKQFPALFDLQKLKEKYSDRYWDFIEVITEKLVKILTKFIEFIKYANK
jgi:hypothetical protein